MSRFFKTTESGSFEYAARMLDPFRLRSSWFVALFAFALAGCPKSESKPSADKSSADDKKGDDKKTSKDDEGDDDDKTADDEGDDKDDKKAGDDAPTTIDPSKPPTSQEWNDGDEIAAGDDDIGCEVKGVREWVRVSCRKKSPGGGAPSDVDVLRGKTKDTFVFVGNGVTSLVAPVVPGTDVEARFAWTDVVYHVELAWPKGKPKPKTLVDFDKTDESPTAALGDKTCSCYKKINPGAKCDDSDSGWSVTSSNPFCESTYVADCEKLVECARGEPGANPKCPQGYVLSGLGFSCAKECPDGQGCPAGQQCGVGDGAANGKMICFEPN